MKTFTKLFILILPFAFLIGCSSTSQTSKSSSDEEDSYILVSQLSNHINTLPRLSVRGNDVINTSRSTVSGTTSPLFIIDGVQIGRSYHQVLKQLLDQNEKVSVEFLPSSRATIRYGEDGKNGVLIINKQ